MSYNDWEVWDYAGVMFAHAYIHVIPNVEMVTWGNIIHCGSEQAECAHLS